MYETMKVFDCQYGNMPEDVKKVFFDMNDEVGNDCYISYEVQSGTYECNGYFTSLDAWLIEQGAKADETVLIRHWW